MLKGKLLYHIVSSPTTNWVMPLKILNSDTNLNDKKNTLQIHRFMQINNRNIHATYMGKTHENKCININATYKLTHN
jgi:hypothetical protein